MATIHFAIMIILSVSNKRAVPNWSNLTSSINIICVNNKCISVPHQSILWLVLTTRNTENVYDQNGWSLCLFQKQLYHSLISQTVHLYLIWSILLHWTYISGWCNQYYSRPYSTKMPCIRSSIEHSTWSNNLTLLLSNCCQIVTGSNIDLWNHYFLRVHLRFFLCWTLMQEGVMP